MISIVFLNFHGQLGFADASFADVPSGYDCEAEIQDWRSVWPAQKRQWCCEHSGLGCELRHGVDEKRPSTPRPISDRAQLASKQLDKEPQTSYDCDQGSSKNLKSLDGQFCVSFDFVTSGVHMIRCNGQPTQQWHYQEGALKSEYNYKCLTRDSAQATLKLEECSGSDPQRWKLEQNHIADFTVTHCLSQESGAQGRKADVATVRVERCSGNAVNQRWSWTSGESPQQRTWCCEQRGIGCHERATATNRPQVDTSPSTTRPAQITPTNLADLVGLGGDPTHHSSGTALLGRSQSDDSQGIASASTKALYDCSVEIDGDDEKWNAAKRLWCCLKVDAGRIGCPSLPTTTIASPSEYDCISGFSAWQLSWSRERKVWCCIHHDRGCDLQALIPARDQAEGGTAASQAANLAKVVVEPTSVPEQTSVPVNMPLARGNCDVEPQTSWSKLKRLYCCAQPGVACSGEQGAATTIPSTTQPDFDCEAGFLNILSYWSSERTVWCCQNKGRYCPASTTTPMHWDCSGSSRYWPFKKADWCCEKKGRGCFPGSAARVFDVAEPAQFNCQEGDGVRQWTHEHAQWCCSHTGTGCDGLPRGGIIIDDAAGGLSEKFNIGASIAGQGDRGANVFCIIITMVSIAFLMGFMFRIRQTRARRDHEIDDETTRKRLLTRPLAMLEAETSETE